MTSAPETQTALVVSPVQLGRVALPRTPVAVNIAVT